MKDIIQWFMGMDDIIRAGTDGGSMTVRYRVQPKGLKYVIALQDPDGRWRYMLTYDMMSICFFATAEQAENTAKARGYKPLLTKLSLNAK